MKAEVVKIHSGNSKKLKIKITLKIIKIKYQIGNSKN